MKYYLAPMEGITGFVFRNAYRDIFGDNFDKYFSPFITAHEKKGFGERDKRDIDPANNKGINLIPQMLINKKWEFDMLEELLSGLGYDEVNLNFGCPNGTVVSKGRGSGILKDTEGLERFLDEVFEKAVTKVSVKTRVGFESPKEIEQIMNVYNKFPIHELIIHPRVRQQQYYGVPDLEAYRYAAEHTDIPLCYNGDVWSKEHFDAILESCKECNIERVMLGRGIVADPFLVEELDGKITERDYKKLSNFLDRLTRDYVKVMSSDTPALYRIKEVWTYMKRIFPDDEKLCKKIFKSNSTAEYTLYKNELLSKYY